MGFWIFMLLMDLLLPVLMIACGRYFMKKPPKKINTFCGYRTPMSMKSQATWEFAQSYCGKIWYVCGVVLLPLTVIGMLLAIGKSVDGIGIVGGMISGVQLIAFIGAIFPTEAALKRNFDENGKRL